MKRQTVELVECATDVAKLCSQPSPLLPPPHRTHLVVVALAVVLVLVAPLHGGWVGAWVGGWGGAWSVL